jgi:hypothetical protein
MREPRPGPLRALLVAYRILAVAALARSGAQLATRASAAPLAYGLSAFAGAVYLTAAIALAAQGPAARRVALVACSTELAGVLGVGTLSLAIPDAFGDQSVWSQFGAGYGFAPLVLPPLGLWWLTSTLAPRWPSSDRCG